MEVRMTVPRPTLEGVARDLYFLRRPDLWTTWPYFPVVHHRPGGDNDLGVVCDFAHTSGRTGFRCAVFLCNIFYLPDTEEEVLALPREVFDTFEEMTAAGWAVD
jgi:hypothetical protein